MRTSFALDDSGEVFLVGGTAVVPVDPQLVLPLLGYLNSGVADEYLAEMTPAFRGGFKKFEPQHISQLPVPEFIVKSDVTSIRLGAFAWAVVQAQMSGQEEEVRKAEAEIERLVAEEVGGGR